MPTALCQLKAGELMNGLIGLEARLGMEGGGVLA
jgi:hypothetical protein